MPQNVYADDLAPGWRVDAHIEEWNYTVREITVVDDRVVLSPSSGSPAFRGQDALAVYVPSLAPFSGPAGEVSRIIFRPPEPVEHYKTLRFAFHPGSSETVIIPIMFVFVNGRHLASAVLSPHPRWAHVSRTVFDMSNREWHVIEFPLDFPELNDPIESIEIATFLQGTFYLDEIQLLPDVMTEPWRLTAVQESRDSALPSAFALQQNYPNPFNSGTVIRFDLPKPGETELSVYNLVGQKVVSLVNGVREAGSYSLRWDGRNDVGQSLASGVYFYRLQAEEQSETRKLLLLR